MRTMRRATFAVTAVMGMIAAKGLAAWIGTPGIAEDWSDPNNWSPVGVPTTGLTYVKNGGIAVASSGMVYTNGTIAIGQNGAGTVVLNDGCFIDATKILVADQTGVNTLYINGGTIKTGSNKDFVLAQNGTANTGTVVMAGGDVTAYNLFVGKSGTGNFVLSNGVIRSTNSSIIGNTGIGMFHQCGGTNSVDGGTDLYLANSTSSVGAYILDGGTLVCSDFMLLGSASNAVGALTINGGTCIVSNNIVLGNGTSGVGLLTVNGGNKNLKALGGNLRVGYGENARGELILNNHTNAFKTVIVGDAAKSCGCVVMSDSDIAVSNGVAMSGASNEWVQSGGRLAITAGGFSVGGALEGRFTTSNHAAFSADSMTLSAKGVLSLNDSDITVTNAATSAVVTVACGGTVELNGGSLMADTFAFSAGTGSNPPAIRVTDGVVCSKVNTLVGGGAPIIQTGGLFSNTLFYVQGTSNSVARFEISGGIFRIAGTSLNNFAIFNTNGCEFCLKGSAPDVRFDMFSYYAGVVRPFLAEYILDKSPAHLAPVKIKSGYTCGHLRVELDGGVLLAQTNAFAVMTADSSLYTGVFGYLSLPDTNMWAVTLEGGRESRITLADGYNKGVLSMGGAQATGPFDALPMGCVALENVRTNRLVELTVRMAVQAGAKTVEEVVNGLVAAGYTNSAVENMGIYNVRLAIPAADVVDHAVAPVSRFAWDFTKTPGITAIDTVVTNAAVTALSVEYTKLPSSGTLIAVR